MAKYPFDVSALPPYLRDLEAFPEIITLDHHQSIVERTVDSIVNLVVMKETPHLFFEVRRHVLSNLNSVATLWNKLENLISLNALSALLDALFIGGVLKQRA